MRQVIVWIAFVVTITQPSCEDRHVELLPLESWYELAELAADAPLPEAATPAAVEPAPPSTKRPPRVEDPYSGWRTWCERPEPAPCATDDDCTLDRTGRSTRCIKPYWSGEERFCMVDPGRKAARAHRDVQRQRIEQMVDGSFCTGRCDETAAKQVLTMVAMRESSMRPWKFHRLDVDSNRSSWKRRAARYQGNRHYGDEQRWQGWGLYGQQAAIYLDVFDPKAPPEILCRDVEATDMWLSRARIAWMKQTDLGITPTWATIEGALSTGDLRADPSTRHDVHRVLAKIGRSADTPIPLRDLGQGLGNSPDERRRRAQEIHASLPAAYAI